MKKTRPPSYAWARRADASHVHLGELSERAWEGYEYALELAEDARARARAVVHHNGPQRPLTVAELAERDGRTPRQVFAMLERARFELFGSLTDSAVYKRAQTLERRVRRSCQQPGCPNAVPVSAPGQRRHCDRHATGAARTRRHRARTQPENQRA